jgi:hypothetical protein
MDCGFDGFHHMSLKQKGTVDSKWLEDMKSLKSFEAFCNEIDSPVQTTVNAIVNELLSKCAIFKPAWISVPQLPIIDGTDRNKINRALAKAAGNWKNSHGFSGQLILPLIFMHQKQVTKKTERNPKIQQAEKCYLESQADGFWVVDQSLSDESGSSALQQKRFKGVISLHEELNTKITSRIKIGGPYWGLNIVLWAKGLIEYPVVGIGTGYSFFISGGMSHRPSAKIAIPSLRRRVRVTPELANWLEKAVDRLAVSHPARAELLDIKKNLTLFKDPARAKEQVAGFYKKWYDSIAAVPASGRSMALFQDLSSAYSLGKSLPPISEEGGARRPEAVAEPLMLSCL